EARFVRFTVMATNDGIQPCIDELEVYTTDRDAGNVALAASGCKATASSEYPNAAIHKIAHLNDGRHGNGRSWISNEPGRGWLGTARSPGVAPHQPRGLGPGPRAALPRPAGDRVPGRSVGRRQGVDSCGRLVGPPPLYAGDAATFLRRRGPRRAACGIGCES